MPRQRSTETARAGTLSLTWSRAIESIALSGRCIHAFDDEADKPMTLVLHGALQDHESLHLKRFAKGKVKSHEVMH